MLIVIKDGNKVTSKKLWSIKKRYTKKSSPKMFLKRKYLIVINGWKDPGIIIDRDH